MEKYDNYIAIDPDRQKSGVAFVHRKTKQCEATNLSFPDLLDYLDHCKKVHEETGESYIVIVEAGWLNEKSNFHPYQGHRAEKIARDVGANQETGKKIIEMCKHKNIPVEEQAPLVKCWAGPDRKITQKEIVKFTGIMGRLNQDARDALLLAWVSAGLPIKM